MTNKERFFELNNDAAKKCDLYLRTDFNLIIAHKVEGDFPDREKWERLYKEWQDSQQEFLTFQQSLWWGKMQPDDEYIDPNQANPK